MTCREVPGLPPEPGHRAAKGKPMNDSILNRTFCFEFTDFPDVDEAWLEKTARALGKDQVNSMGRKLEWGQVVTMPEFPPLLNTDPDQVQLPADSDAQVPIAA